MNANAVFDSLFKFDLAKSSVPSGSELMARVGLRDNETTGPGRTGRPKKNEDPAIARLKMNVDPANPHVTALALDEDDSNRWLSGSVVRVVFPDGSEKCFVLLNNVRLVPWIDE